MSRPRNGFSGTPVQAAGCRWPACRCGVFLPRVPRAFTEPPPCTGSASAGAELTPKQVGHLFQATPACPAQSSSRPRLSIQSHFPPSSRPPSVA